MSQKFTPFFYLLAAHTGVLLYFVANSMPDGTGTPSRRRQLSGMSSIGDASSPAPRVNLVSRPPPSISASLPAAQPSTSSSHVSLQSAGGAASSETGVRQYNDSQYGAEQWQDQFGGQGMVQPPAPPINIQRNTSQAPPAASSYIADAAAATVAPLGVQRRASSAAGSGNTQPCTSDGGATTTSSSSPPNRNTASAESVAAGGGGQSASDPQFKFGSLLMAALAVPLGILFAFGGRTTLLTLCFGCVAAYVCDLMGSIEGAILLLVLTTVGLLASLVWSARLILAESMGHFCIIFVMAAQLLYAITCVTATFKSARMEFDTFFFYMETLIFTTLPLLGTSTVTWFLCIEFGHYSNWGSSTGGFGGGGSTIQPHVVFAIVYGIYLKALGAPRVSSMPTVFARPKAISGIVPANASNSNSKQHQDYYTYLRKAASFTLPTTAVQLCVYVLPVVMCPILYCAVNYWTVHSFVFTPASGSGVATLASGWALKQLSGLLGSALLPLLISALVLEEHYDRYFILGANLDAEGPAAQALLSSKKKESSGNLEGSMRGHGQEDEEGLLAASISSGDSAGGAAAGAGGLQLMSSTWHKAAKTGLEVIKLGGFVSLFFTVESHPILNDLKGYSGLRDNKANLLIVSICLCLGMALVQYRRGRLAEKNADYLASIAERVITSVQDTTGLSGLTVGDNRSLRRKIGTFLAGPTIPRTFVTLCLCTAGTLAGLLLRLPGKAYPVLASAIIGCSEYYQRWKNVRTKDMPAARGWVFWIAINGMMSVAATCISIVVFLFCAQTIHFLDFDFDWFADFGAAVTRAPSEDATMYSTGAGSGGFSWAKAAAAVLGWTGLLRPARDGDPFSDDPSRLPDEGGLSAKAFTQLAAWAFCQAISLPTFVVVTGNDFDVPEAGVKDKDKGGSVVPGSGNGIDGCIPGLANLAGLNAGGTLNGATQLGTPTNGMEWLLRGFCVFFSLFSIVIALLELLMREQDWAAYGLQVETVYPDTCMFLSSALLIWCVVHLLRLGRCDTNTAFLCALVHSFKLLHFVGLPATSIATCIFTAATCTYPFTVYYIGTLSAASSVGATYDRFSRPVSSQDKATLARLGVKIPRSGPGIVQLLLFSVSGTYGIYLFNQCNLSALLLSTSSGREVSVISANAAAVAAWAVFHIALLHTYLPSQASLAKHGISLLLVVTVLSVLLAAEAFGPLSFSIDMSSSTLLVVERHPEMAAAMGGADVDQTGLFLLLCVSLLLLAGGGVLDVRRVSSRALFACLFAYSAAQMLLWWGFPLSLSKFSPHYGLLQLPSLYCYGMASTATVCGLLGVMSMLPAKGASRSSTLSSATRHLAQDYAPYAFIASACLPMLALLKEVWGDPGADGTVRSVLWVTVVTNGCLGAVLRIAEIVLEIQEQRASASAEDSADTAATSAAVPLRRSAAGNMVNLLCLQSAILCVLWTVGLTLISSHLVLDAELSVPLSTLALLVTSRGSLDFSMFTTYAHHPLMYSAILSAGWWFLHAAHAIFVEGMFGEASSAELYRSATTGGIFHDEVVSFWLSPGYWYPCLNTVLLLVPIPAIYLAFRRHKGDSEDMAFMLAVLSVLSTAGAHAACIRYLGVMGAVLGGWRCREVNFSNTVSNKLI